VLSFIGIVNAYEWLKTKPEKLTELKLDEQKVMKAYRQVCEQMCRLNRNAARLLHKYDAHASMFMLGYVTLICHLLASASILYDK